MACTAPQLRINFRYLSSLTRKLFLLIPLLLLCSSASAVIKIYIEHQPTNYRLEFKERATSLTKRPHVFYAAHDYGQTASGNAWIKPEIFAWRGGIFKKLLDTLEQIKSQRFQGNLQDLDIFFSGYENYERAAKALTRAKSWSTQDITRQNFNLPISVGSQNSRGDYISHYSGDYEFDPDSTILRVLIYKKSSIFSNTPDSLEGILELSYRHKDKDCDIELDSIDIYCLPIDFDNPENGIFYDDAFMARLKARLGTHLSLSGLNGRLQTQFLTSREIYRRNIWYGLTAGLGSWVRTYISKTQGCKTPEETRDIYELLSAYAPSQFSFPARTKTPTLMKVNGWLTRANGTPDYSLLQSRLQQARYDAPFPSPHEPVQQLRLGLSPSDNQPPSTSSLHRKDKG